MLIGKVWKDRKYDLERMAPRELVAAFNLGHHADEAAFRSCAAGPTGTAPARQALGAR